MMRSVLLLVSSSSDEEEPPIPGLVAAERMGLLGVTVCVCECGCVRGHMRVYVHVIVVRVEVGTKLDILNQQRACFKVYITLHHFLGISLDEQPSITGHILLLRKNCTQIVCTKLA